MQWCDGKRSWYWQNAQRAADDHCGEVREIWLDVETPGLHTVQFSMREDGFEMDRFLLTTDELMTRPYANPGPDPADYLVQSPDTAVEPRSWSAVKGRASAPGD